MRKEIALLLKQKADEVAKIYSNPNRALNNQKETFIVAKIVPLSENTAGVIFDKASGKQALCFFYWINGGTGWWSYFFVTDSHVLGMQRIGKLLARVESENFAYNFEDNTYNFVRMELVKNGNV